MLNFVFSSEADKCWKGKGRYWFPWQMYTTFCHS